MQCFEGLLWIQKPELKMVSIATFIRASNIQSYFRSALLQVMWFHFSSINTLVNENQTHNHTINFITLPLCEKEGFKD